MGYHRVPIGFLVRLTILGLTRGNQGGQGESGARWSQGGQGSSPSLDPPPDPLAVNQTPSSWSLFLRDIVLFLEVIAITPQASS